MLKRPLRTISLFSGAGGMDLGFEGGFRCISRSINKDLHPDWVVSEDGIWVTLKKTGIEIVFANDIRNDSCIVWEYNRPSEVQEADIFRLDSIVDLVKRHKSGWNIFPSNVDLIIGGFPCQDFSLNGRRLGLKSDIDHYGHKSNCELSDENRGNLYRWFLEVVNIVRPKMFIAENVKALLSMPGLLERIESDVDSITNGQYILYPVKTLSSVDYGIAQNRDRVFFVGFRKDALDECALDGIKKGMTYYSPYPIKTHGGAKELVNYVCCRDVIGDLPEPDCCYDCDQRYYSKTKYQYNGQGQIEIDIDNVSPTIRSEHHGNIQFRRLSKRHGGKNEEELSKGLLERRLTIRECARIQSFPDNY